jgi:hypothetical protein
MDTHFTSSPELARPSSLAVASAPQPGSGARVWAGAVILAGGLGLIVLGGCFLYGVLQLVRPAAFNPGLHAEPAPAASTLLVVLYVMAFASFVGAAVLLILGLWGLAKILLEKQSQTPREREGV